MQLLSHVSPLRILFEDERLVVVDKPAGVLVHHTHLAPRTEPSLQQLLRDQVGSWVQPVHRLDRAASGAIAFAKDRRTTALLMEHFQQRRVRKDYRAVARGHAPESATIDHPLRPNPEFRPKGSATAAPLPAHTELRCLGKVELPFAVGRYATARYSWLEVRIETGRTHQIRRHLQHFAHPLIGDTTYGDGKHNQFWRAELGVSRLMLFSWKLGLPWNDSLLEIACPLPEELIPLWQRWGWGF
jgi:tRNA pseudouridine65 synthase